MEGGNHLYPYRAYMHNALSYGKDMKESQLYCSGWAKDTNDKFDNDGGTNLGFKERMKWVTGEHEMCGPILLDMFLQQRLLLNKVDVRLKFTPSKPEFQLMSLLADNAKIIPKVIIKQAILYVRRVKISDTVILSNEKQLETQNALYPVQHTEVMTYTIATGSQSHNKEAVFRGMMPKLVIVGLVDNGGFNGVRRKGRRAGRTLQASPQGHAGGARRSAQ